MNFQTNALNESTEKTVMLDNQEISVSNFNRKLESLKPGQRIVESSENNFHTIERMLG